MAYATGDLVPHAWSRQRRRSVAPRRRPAAHRAVVVARRRGLGGRRGAGARPLAALLRHPGAAGWASTAAASGWPAPPRRAARSGPSAARRWCARRTPATPTAQDPLLPRDPTLPRAGVIDPSWFRDADGSSYLLYKTDRMPVHGAPRRPDPRRAVGAARGDERRARCARPGVLENPVLTQRPEGYVLLASEGDWTRCGYRTPLAAARPACSTGRGRRPGCCSTRRPPACAGRAAPTWWSGATAHADDVPARLDLPRHRAPVRRDREVGPQAATARTTARCTPPSWTGSTVCRRSPGGSARAEVSRT